MLTRRAVALGLGALPLTLATSAKAASTAADINRDASEALDQLFRINPVADAISKKSLGVLIFPKITKGGLIFGGSYGEGVLRDMGKPVNYYSSVSASWGLQAGVQTYSYVVFLIT